VSWVAALPAVRAGVAASGLPVLVWIHGGSFMNGSSSVTDYDGAAFARDGVVCVSINYRLSAEGFLLIGSNLDEARLFLVAPGAIDFVDDATLAAVAAAYGLSGDGLAVYRANRPGAGPGDVMAAVITDWFFRIPSIRVAEARAAAGAAGTWMYRFDHPEPWDNHGFGASHAVEIPFVFDTLARSGSAALIGDAPSQAVADRVHRVWVDFISRGNPGWAPYDVASRTTGLLTQTITPVDDPAGDERALWAGIR
jgi:para-nitrobenzyl esterase